MSPHARNTIAAVFTFVVAVLGWGWWHAHTHASVNIRIEDHGLATDRQTYGTPHGAAVTLLDESGRPLALAHSIEPEGYLAAIHPDPAIGDCRQFERSGPGEFADCYSRQSAWAATWAPQVRSADVRVGACALKQLPLRIQHSGGDWWLWWAPLPHVGGVPRSHWDFAVAIDSRKCKVQGPEIAPPAQAASKLRSSSSTSEPT